MIRTVECCRKRQRIISADSRKRGARYLVPPPRQFQRSQPVSVAALFVAIGISIESVHWRSDGHRHQSDTDHKHSQIDRTKPFDRIAGAADDENSDQEQPLHRPERGHIRAEHDGYYWRKANGPGENEEQKPQARIYRPEISRPRLSR